MSPDRALRGPRASGPLLRAVALAGALGVSLLGAVVGPSVAATDTGTSVVAADPGSTVVGELVHVMAEDEPGTARPDGAADRLSWVQTDAGPVRIPTEQVATVPAGSTVALTVGGPVADQAGEHGHGTARTVLDGEVLASPGRHRAGVVPARRPDQRGDRGAGGAGGAAPDGRRLRDVVAAVDGPVADFWAEQAGGAITVGVTDERDWVATSAGCATPEAMWDQVAATVGFVAGPGKHLLLRLSGEAAAQSGCFYALAQVGAAPSSDGRLYVRGTAVSLIAHDLGHNFGLSHSSAEQCDGAVEAGTCRLAAYRDYYDVMGPPGDSSAR